MKTDTRGNVRPVKLSGAHSGSGMDRAVEKKKFSTKTMISTGAVVLLLIAIGWYMTEQGGARSLVIDQNRIVIAPVKQGVFEDFIPIRGQVTPSKTVYLDAVEGGRVEETLLEDGAIVKAGDLIVVLSNTALQLDVTRNEAVVTEQLNNMRTIELQLEQNRLQHKRNLVEMDYQIKRLNRQVSRLANLDNAGVATKSQLEDTQDELEYYNNLRVVTLESQLTDARMQETQLKFLQQSSVQLEQHLVFARKNLDALNVRAAVDGKLSGFDAEVGQSIQRGGRLGQIDDLDSFKLSANIDEFYLNRVNPGQSVFFNKEGRRFELTVSKIYPQVNNAQFEVDLIFKSEEPKSIRRGQTIQAKLTLGDSAKALLIPNGAFFQDTGGRWIFVVSTDAKQALRRNVRLGRRNSQYIEVLEGLEMGESVVTSQYSNFTGMDRLSLTTTE